MGIYHPCSYPVRKYGILLCTKQQIFSMGHDAVSLGNWFPKSEGTQCFHLQGSSGTVQEDI